MQRSEEMQKFVDDLSKNMFGRSNSESVEQRVCVICGNPITGFRDALSEKEYFISGMCQTCQDDVFGG